MRSCGSWLARYGLLIGFWSGLSYLRPLWLVGLNLDGWFLSADLRSVPACRERAVRLDRASTQLALRMRTKSRIARDVCAGRLGLLEAASEFRYLDEELPGAPRMPPLLGATTEE